MLPIPFGCREMAHECCKILEEVSHRMEVGLPESGVKRDVFHSSSYHISDGGHSCYDRLYG